jgi:hypothetical protein
MMVEYSKRLWWRTFKWRQMATQAERRHWDIKTVLMWPMLWCLYRRKRTQSIVCSVLIIGQNPWLNALLAWRLSFQYTRIYVWEGDGLDRWNYNVLYTHAFLSFLSRQFGIKKSTIQDYMCMLKEEASCRAEIRVMPDSWCPKESVYDEKTGGWVIKAVQESWPAMEKLETSRLIQQRGLRRSWVGASRVKWASKPEKNPDDSFAAHYVLAKRVYWTSVPPNGVGLEYVQSEDGFEIQSTAPINGYGSAKRIAQKARFFFQQPFKDTEEILSTKATDVID